MNICIIREERENTRNKIKEEEDFEFIFVCFFKKKYFF